MQRYDVAIAASYRPRLIDQTLADIMAELPAVMIVGPRASGKTTTARRHARTTVRLDRDVEAEPFRADADTVIETLDPPVLFDEWQAVPQIIGSVKRAVDEGTGAGRFILTGSVRADLLEETWAATGRIVRLTQWGLSERELLGKVSGPTFFDRVFDGDLDSIRAPSAHVDLRDYVDRALRGTYPDVALGLSDAARYRWLSAYVDQLMMRDAALADPGRDPVRLRRYFTAVAGNTAGIIEHKTLYDAARVSRDTAIAYDTLLSLLFATELVPAWHSNRLNRLTRAPKRYLTDTALLSPLLGVETRGVLRNGDLLGRVIDTFVLSQLRPEVEASARPPRLFHLRQEGGAREIDLVAEGADGRIVAMEVKATAAPRADDARHLVWLREQLGDQFAAGIVWHTGPRTIAFGDRITALPISALWGDPPG